MPGDELDYFWDNDLEAILDQQAPGNNQAPNIGVQNQAIPQAGMIGQVEQAAAAMYNHLTLEQMQQMMNELHNQPAQYYHSSYGEYSFDRGKKTKEAKNYINDDIDMNNKVSEEREMVVLTSEEIKKAVVASRPDSVLLGELGKQAQFSVLSWPLGTIVRGALPGESNEYHIVLGHIINSKVFNNHFDARTEAHKAKNFTKGYVLYNTKTSKIIGKPESEVYNYFGATNITGVLTALTNLKYKLVNTELSGRVFGLAKAKANMVDLVTSVFFEKGSSTKLGQDTYYVIIRDELGNRNLKFCISDLEPILPNVVGYNFPKDKTIVTNSKVILKENPNHVYVVKTVYVNPSSKRISKRGQSRQLDVLRIVNLENNNDDRKVYAKNVKLL